MRHLTGILLVLMAAWPALAQTYVQGKNLVQVPASTATAAGTTSLTRDSDDVQRFTGTTTQSVKLPDATTLQVGRLFTLINESTGAVTAKYNDASTALALSAGDHATFRLESNGTTNGSWKIVGFTSAATADAVVRRDSSSRISAAGIKGSTGVLTLDIDNQYAWDVASTTKAFGWYQFGLIDGSGVPKVNLNSAILYDGSGNYSALWGNRQLYDPSANIVFDWSNTNIPKVTNLAQGFATRAATTQITLTNASARYQQVTGTGTQRFNLPNATTLPVGTEYIFSATGGSSRLTVYDGAGNQLDANEPYMLKFTLSDNSTAAGAWAESSFIDFANTNSLVPFDVTLGGTGASSFTGKSGNVAGLIFYDGTKLTNDATVTDVGYDTTTNTVKAANLDVATTTTLSGLSASLPVKTNASKQLSTAAISIASGSSEITGTLAVANGGTGATTASESTVFAGPVGNSASAAAPSFRQLNFKDITYVPSYLTTYATSGTKTYNLPRAFFVSAMTTAPAAGDTYTNNAITWTILMTAGNGGTWVIASGNGAPSNSGGTLTRATGTGDATITFSAWQKPNNLHVRLVGAGGGGGASGASGCGSAATAGGSSNMSGSSAGGGAAASGCGATSAPPAPSSASCGETAPNQCLGISGSGGYMTVYGPTTLATAGGAGGSNPLGAGGYGQEAGAGTSGQVCGGGGSGGGTTAGVSQYPAPGGSAGAYVELWLTGSLNNQYTPSVGAKGTGQAVGTAAFKGGDGADGCVIIEANFN